MTKRPSKRRAYSATSAKAQRFVLEYPKDSNGAAAARRAGYAERTAKQAAHYLLKHPAIRAQLTAALEQHARRTGLKVDNVLNELRILISSDVRDYQVDEAGHLELRDGVPEEAWRAVSSVKHRTLVTGKPGYERTTHEIEYRLWDKNTALTNAMKHLGLLIDKVQHDVTDRLADALKLARERVHAR